MPLICIEGASAVGKSSTSRMMQEIMDTYIIDEVNKLFERPNDAANTWYFERQVERIYIANKKLKHHEIVILDGDPFQPLWYNWCYDFKEWQSLEVLDEFFRIMISRDKIQFPDRYFYLYTSEEELRKRKEIDSKSKRKNFEKHLYLIEPQKAHFEYMNQLEPTLVTFINAETINNNVESIVKAQAKNQSKGLSDLVLYDRLIEWLRCNKASNFVK